MSDAQPLVTVETGDGVTTLTLNAVSKRNALAMPMREDLADALDAAIADPACRAIVLTGAGEHFCAGGDIGGMGGVDAISGRNRLASGHRIVRAMIEGETPVISAVEGYAVGAGLSLAIAADIVVAARTAKFACSFNRLGLVADFGAAWLLPMRAGIGRARQIMLTGDTFEAESAERWGLAEILTETGGALAEATALARRIAATTAPLSNAFAKRLLARMPGTLDDVLRAEADSQAALYTSRDFAEGRAAFLGKRKPVFEGR
ncbi:enoyl-CoA hydratase/isomerase family protein [Enterovirga rhinocerotis]|uniref:Short chain enoyl-CoA hydratase /enoyl-CoA hydratase n=1 Tax=Enterovirga rhinocerotis TaxID=1339210 RepID=A0A4V3DYU7_9HYPH|nr:enoyl-CoA hydratase/isomerase family protein [Enterovirga rhinocerotis]TDR94039.1 short chain enoyl-CoA hydratase /enoyl-CoA hydratase [Enterovirga rhinocerotis]